MPAGYSFRPRAWALALGAAACAAGVALGIWQSHRADEKRALEEHAPPLEARGVFLPELTVLIDNRMRHQRPGYEVVTPLRTAAGALLVNRGWIAAGPSRERLPEVRTPAGEVSVAGVERERLPHVLALGAPSAGKVRQNLDIDDYAAQTGLKLEHRILEQHSPLDDGLLRDWPRDDSGAEKSEAYSLQWYSLAALALVMTIVLSLRRDAP